MFEVKMVITRFVNELKPDVIQQYLMSAGAVLGLALSIMLGGIDKMIWALFGLAVVDYALGTAGAFKSGIWDSSTGYWGIVKKSSMFAFVGIAVAVDYAVGTDQTLRQIVIGAYGVNEAGSILENIDKLGFSNLIPASIRNGLSRAKDDSDAGKKVKF